MIKQDWFLVGDKIQYYEDKTCKFLIDDKGTVIESMNVDGKILRLQWINTIVIDKSDTFQQITKP